LTIYIARRRKNKSHPKYKGAMSAPCNHCLSLIKKCGIQKIKYTDDFDNIVSVRTKDYNNNHVSSGIKIMKEMKILS
jgi:deoxycytidylate deaminase